MCAGSAPGRLRARLRAGGRGGKEGGRDRWLRAGATPQASGVVDWLSSQHHRHPSNNHPTPMTCTPPSLPFNAHSGCCRRSSPRPHVLNLIFLLFNVRFTDHLAHPPTHTPPSHSSRSCLHAPATKAAPARHSKNPSTCCCTRLCCCRPPPPRRRPRTQRCRPSRRQCFRKLHLPAPAASQIVG